MFRTCHQYVRILAGLWRLDSGLSASGGLVSSSDLDPCLGEPGTTVASTSLFTVHGSLFIRCARDLAILREPTELLL
jgi:hypothetical protein